MCFKWKWQEAVWSSIPVPILQRCVKRSSTNQLRTPILQVLYRGVVKVILSSAVSPFGHETSLIGQAKRNTKMSLKVERKGETSKRNGKMKNGKKLTLNPSSNLISNSRFCSYFSFPFLRACTPLPVPRKFRWNSNWKISISYHKKTLCLNM